MHLTARAQKTVRDFPDVADSPPVTADEFAAAMAALGPFEAEPHLAVAVSGGRDSLALTLLAQRWVRDRAGSLMALIVDHRLRRESSDEAQHVADLLRSHGVDSEILAWRASKPSTGLSEAARAARYALLQDRCRELNVLHLLVGHHADDQAETLALRLEDGSGPEGLAGMAAIVETAHGRMLRPLLAFARPRLAATVMAAGLRWVDDPSNENPAYARVRLRKTLKETAGRALRDIASDAGELRRITDGRLAAMFADLVSADPRGFAWLDLAGFISLPAAFSSRLLSRLAATYGGSHYPARRAGLETAAAALRAKRNVTAGGCLFQIRGARILVCREPGAIGGEAPRGQGDRPLLFLWDRRYWLTCPREGELAPLGAPGRCKAIAGGLEMLRDLPAPVAEALPGLWGEGELKAVFVPKMAQCHSGTGDRRVAAAPATLIACLDAVFRPLRGLADPAWPLVLPPGKPMYLDRQSFSLRGRS